MVKQNQDGDTILEHSEIVAKFAKTDEKLIMTIEESTTLSREIAFQVTKLPEQPDLVLGIDKGALLMAKVISSELQIPMKTIRIQRKGSKIKEKLETIPGLAKFLSRWYKIPVINIPLKHVLHQLSGLSKVSNQVNLNVREKRVLLVDDAMETGQSLVAAKALLTAGCVKSVMTAVLTWSNKHDSQQKNQIQPDIFISRRIQRFPWSRNSPFYNEYEKWLLNTNE